MTEQEHSTSLTFFGFWIYILTDCILFGILFATYAVLHNNTFGGPPGGQIFNLHEVLIETFLLLTSSLTCGLGMIEAFKRNKKKSLIWWGVTFILGASFVAMELREFTHLVHTGNSWQRSGFLSAFFTLVGTHGFHVSIGLVLMGVLMAQTLKFGFTHEVLKRFNCLRLFWHFLDLVWIFIFTVVYLMAVK